MELWNKIPELRDRAPPAFSAGWLDGFKKRHNIRWRTQYGEAGSVNQEVSAEEVEKLRNEISTYKPRDVHNMDEGGLFWKMVPDRTLATESTSGTKKEKNRISFALTSNADGSKKEQALFIGRAQNPRAFRRRRIKINSLPIEYHFNEKAWMTSKIIKIYLRNFNKKMRSQHRNVLLLLDNFSAHSTAVDEINEELTNVTVRFLPANTTSIFQPIDIGIIKNFKALYKRR